ncbi:hypothetical protein KSP40_PGU007311 [Platanthera guangdongensis]|uniref:Uncharacterized protein n=1 Tax=Platanthera guangdongensis TaxID=2320717 RepID=A0ABR2MMZ4_9ASPA
MPRPPPPSWSYGTAVPGHSPGAGGFYPPGYFHPNANQQYTGNIQHAQLLPYLSQPVFQNPRVVQQQNTFPINAGFTAAGPSHVPPATLEMVERAASKAHKDLLASGENVSVWKVSQSALVALKVDSWSSLGLQLQYVPTLQRLLLIEGKVNAFIHCFVCARKIASMHELEISICQNEGVRQFEELGLGPFLQQPLVKDYFTYSSDLNEVFKITSVDIVLSLQKFMSKFKKKISAEKFLRFLADQKSISKDKLGVRIQDLRFYVSHIKEVSKAECNVFREKLDGSWVGSDRNEVLEKKSGSQPLNIASEKQILDKRFNYISSCVKTFSSECNEIDGKHVYFNVSDDCDDCNESKEDDISDAYKCDGNDKTCLNNYQSLSVKGCGQLVSSCPYPSKTEEMVRLGLKPADSYKTLPATAPTPSRTPQTAFRRKRKKESKDSKICKYFKKEEAAELKVYDHTCDLTLHNGDVEKFVATWKVACGEHSVSEVLDTMLSFYVEKVHKREKIRKFASSYPFIGMLNVAIVSIKRGMFESIYDTFQALNEMEIIGTDSVGSGEMIEVMPMVEAGDPTMGTYCGSPRQKSSLKRSLAGFYDCGDERYLLNVPCDLLRLWW